MKATNVVQVVMSLVILGATVYVASYAWKRGQQNKAA
jgi:hypothetical protein